MSKTEINRTIAEFDAWKNIQEVPVFGLCGIPPDNFKGDCIGHTDRAWVPDYTSDEKQLKLVMLRTLSMWERNKFLQELSNACREDCAFPPYSENQMFFAPANLAAKIFAKLIADSEFSLTF
jgi:hypothetical protein